MKISSLITILTAFVVVVLSATTITAEVYQWTDDKGVVTFKDSPPPPSKKQRKVKVYNDSEFSTSPGAPQPKNVKNEPRQKNAPVAPPKKESYVEIFTTSWCPYCKQAVAFLRSKGVNFTEYDVEKDPAAAQRKDQLDKKRGVPFALINGTPIHGFAKQTYEQLLDGNSQKGAGRGMW